MKITILGAGAWGTALALSLASKNEVVLWGRNPEMMQRMQTERSNQDYLPGFSLPPSIQASADFEIR